MKLNKLSLALTAAIFWGGAVLLVGIANLIFHSYAANFMSLVASIYPGCHYLGGSGFGGVMIATLWALIDGLVCGFLFALIYNAFVKE